MVRTRMAPSPTGEFHIGGMRTLLYNYAYARKNNGSFVLRIEDTDRERLVEGALDRTLGIIKEYGLTWDEGPEVGGPNAPYIQSERLELYKKYALQLIEDGNAYYCFCTRERLDEMRKSQQAAGSPTTKYDRHCLGLSPDQISKNLKEGLPHVVRLKVPSERVITYDDLFLGKVDFPSGDVEDQILLKSDGFPTYHLAVVVDDHLMEITHILRGSEWLASTPKHVLLYEFLNWKMPATGHLPGLKEVGSTKKMSKRFGDVAASEFLKNGYLPEALLNFIMLLGWNPGTDREVFTLEEFINEFTLEHIHKTDLVAFDREKLLWFNGYYIRQLKDAELYEKVMEWSDKWGVKLVSQEGPQDYAVKVTGLVKDRMKVLADFNELSSYFFSDPVIGREVLTSYSASHWESILTGFRELLLDQADQDWNKNKLDDICHAYLEGKPYKVKEAFMTLRTAITGEAATPPLFEVMELLGRDTVLRRINTAVTQTSI